MMTHEYTVDELYIHRGIVDSSTKEELLPLHKPLLQLLRTTFASPTASCTVTELVCTITAISYTLFRTIYDYMSKKKINASLNKENRVTKLVKMLTVFSSFL